MSRYEFHHDNSTCRICGEKPCDCECGVAEAYATGFRHGLEIAESLASWMPDGQMRDAAMRLIARVKRS